MDERLTVGLDIGGTKIDAGMIDATGNIFNKIRLSTGAHEGLDTVLQKIFHAIDTVIKGIYQPIAGIGIGVPGQVDVNTGVVLFAPNLKWKYVELKKIIQEKYPLQVEIDNDANCGALAEAKLGAAQGVKSMVWISVGTGIGGGIIINNHLLRGAGFAGGEIGHITLQQDGPVCGCGNHGCMEALASGTAIIRQVKEGIMAKKRTGIVDMVDGDMSKITVSTIAKAADQGDRLASEVLNKAGQYLGIGIASIVNILNPEMVVLTGGVMEVASTYLMKPIQDTARLRVLVSIRDSLQIKLSQLHGNAGLIGTRLLILS
jgi:glucokinase